MPGTDPNTQDDDDGSLNSWLHYKVWGVRGYVIFCAAIGLAFAAGLAAKAWLY